MKNSSAGIGLIILQENVLVYTNIIFLFIK